MPNVADPSNRGSSSVTSSVKWTVFTILSLAGLAVSWLLSKHFFDVRGGTSGFSSFCNVSATMNCDAVAASRWAELVAGIPLSSFAAGWYAALVILSLMGRFDEWRREMARAVLGMSAVAVAFSLVYLGIMAFSLRTYCLYCLVTDGINLMLLGLSFALQPRDRAALNRQTWKTVAGVTVGALFVTIVLLQTMNHSRISAEAVQSVIDSTLSGAPVAVDADPAKYPQLGPPQAPVTIVEFSDFQCPHCRMGATIMNSVLNRHPGQVRIVFRNYPLDSGCNPKMGSPMHPVACEAARVGWCANQRGKFKPVYEAIFENQESLKPGMPVQLAAAAGLDEGEIKACAASSEAMAAVTRDLEEGGRLDVQSTPTFFINGYRVEGALPLPVWSGLIERLSAPGRKTGKP